MGRTSLEKPFDLQMASRMTAEAKAISSPTKMRSCLDYLSCRCFSTLEKLEIRYTNLSHQVQFIPEYDDDDALYDPSQRVQEAFEKASAAIQQAIIAQAGKLSTKAQELSHFNPADLNGMPKRLVRLWNLLAFEKQFKSLEGIVNRVTDPASVRDVLIAAEGDDEKKVDINLPVANPTLDKRAINQAFYEANGHWEPMARSLPDLKEGIKDDLNAIKDKIGRYAGSISNMCTPRAAVAASLALASLAYYFRSQLPEVFSPAVEFYNSAIDTTLLGYNSLAVGVGTVASLAILNLACCKR